MKLETIKDILKKCLDLLYTKDFELFEYNTLDPLISERCLTFRLGYYLQNEFPNYCVDSEYNRHLKGLKIMDEHRIYPDLIVHVRGKDDSNLLWIEIKKNINECSNDIERLKKVTQEEYYKYDYGVMVVLEKDFPILTYYSNGKQIK